MQFNNSSSIKENKVKHILKMTYSNPNTNIKSHNSDTMSMSNALANNVKNHSIKYKSQEISYLANFSESFGWCFFNKISKILRYTVL